MDDFEIDYDDLDDTFSNYSEQSNESGSDIVVDSKNSDNKVDKNIVTENEIEDDDDDDEEDVNSILFDDDEEQDSEEEEDESDDEEENEDDDIVLETNSEDDEDIRKINNRKKENDLKENEKDGFFCEESNEEEYDDGNIVKQEKSKKKSVKFSKENSTLNGSSENFQRDEIKLNFRSCFKEAQKGILKKDFFKFGALPPSFQHMRDKIYERNPKSPKIPISRYQFTRLIGFRLVQLSKGSISFAHWDTNVIEPTLMEQIKMEIDQEVLPLIVSHINPDKSMTYIRAKDFDYSFVIFGE